MKPNKIPENWDDIRKLKQIRTAGVPWPERVPESQWYQVDIPGGHAITWAARHWCKDRFGYIPIVREKAVYDEQNARWVNRRKQPNKFLFKYAEDAMLFKLTWYVNQGNLYADS